MTTKINLLKGDITKLEVDAIVNAANSSLLGGGGVDGAIHLAAGKELLEECRSLGGCRKGEAKITAGYKLPARHIIHTVGPIWNGGHGNEEAVLRNAYTNSLHLAVQHNIKTVAFPNISTGIYRFPKPLAAEIAISVTTDFCTSHPGMLEEITFICFDDENYHIYKTRLDL